MSGKYVLDGHTPRKVEDLVEWAQAFEKHDRRVAQDRIGDEPCRWPDCWWSGTFQFQVLPDGWYCRLGGAPFRIWATHFMEIPEGPK